MPLRERLVIALFLVLPLLITAIGLGELDRRQDEAGHLEAERRLGRILAEVDAEGDQTIDMSRTLRRVERRVFAARDPLPAMRQAVAELQRRFPGLIEAFLLDGEGEIRFTTASSAATLPRAMLRRFTRSGRELLRTGKDFSSLERSFISSFLGPFAPRDATLFSTFQFVSLLPVERYAYVSRPSSRGLFVLFLQTPRSLLAACLADRLERTRRRHPETRLCLIQEAAPRATALTPLGLRGSLARQTWRALDAAPTRVIRIGASRVARRAIQPNTWVVGRLETSGDADQGRRRHGLLWAILLAGFLPVLVPVTLAPLAGSVRIRLVAAFLYAAGVPLLIMGLTAWSYLAERRAVLEEQAHQRVEQVLGTFDKQLGSFVDGLANQFRQRALEVPVDPDDPLARLRREMPAFHARFRFDGLRVFDEDGKQVFVEIASGSTAPREAGMGFLGRMASRYLQRFGGRESPAGPAAPPSHAGGFELEENITGLLDEPTKITFLDSGTSRLLFGLLPLVNHLAQARHLIVLTWDRTTIEEQYLQERLAPLSRLLGDTELYACHLLSQQRAWPPEFRHAPRLSPFLDEIRSASQSRRGRLDTPDGTFLLTGMRGTELSRFFLVGCTSDREIRTTIDALSWRFTFCILVMTGVGLLTGLLLARLFLLPIGALTFGIEEIGRRQFSHRVVLRPGDELGDLGEAFNAMMEGMADLEIAHTLQESFFPGEPLRCGSREIFGSCVTASRVGGDYLDYALLEPNRAFFLIGDVSGHGIGAALVSAMAKATVFHPATAGQPVGILEALHQTLFTVLRRRRMMTCHAAVLNDASLTLDIAGGGHPWPLLIRPGQDPRYLEIGGSPLGASRKHQAGTATFPLQAGDILIFYSDGLIEAIDPRTRSSIGFEAFRSEAPFLVGATARDTVGAIRQWHRARSGRDIPEDDVTIMVIQDAAPPKTGDNPCSETTGVPARPAEAGA